MVFVTPLAVLLLTECWLHRSLALATRNRGPRLVWVLDAPALLCCALCAALGVVLAIEEGRHTPAWLTAALLCLGAALVCWAALSAVARGRAHLYLAAVGAVCVAWAVGSAEVAVWVGCGLLLATQAYEYELWQELDGTPLWGVGQVMFSPEDERVLFSLLYFQALVPAIHIILAARGWPSGAWMALTDLLSPLVVWLWIALALPAWPLGAGLPGVTWLSRRLTGCNLRPRGRARTVRVQA